jgi:hypothetical protein
VAPELDQRNSNLKRAGGVILRSTSVVNGARVRDAEPSHHPTPQSSAPAENRTNRRANLLDRAKIV